MTRNFTINVCTDADPLTVDADSVDLDDRFVTFYIDNEPVLIVATHAVQTIRGTDPRVTDTRPAAAA